MDPSRRTAALLVALGLSLFLYAWLKLDADRATQQGTARGPAPAADGRFRRAVVPESEDFVARNQDEMIAQLEAIGYVSGSQPAPDASGVIFADPARMQAGLTMIVDGHAPQARTIDHTGTVHQRWQLSWEQAFPNADPPADPETTSFWRRVDLLPDGGLLVVFEGSGIVRIDAQSNLVWAVENGAHHDIDIQSDGTFWVLTREGKLRPGASEPVLDDHVTHMDMDGKTLSSHSLLDAWERSDFVGSAPRFENTGDPLHVNSLVVLDDSMSQAGPGFAAGLILLSAMRTDDVFTFDPVQEEIRWVLPRLWHAQHDPSIVPPGRVLVFDNQSGGGQSRVVEYDPQLQTITWLLDEEQAFFYTDTCGLAQRLPNGNTLVTESDGGRTFEVTRGGDIVWDYVTPFRAGDGDEFVATLLQAQRISQIDSSTEVVP